ncbi:Transport and Golgi organization protein 1 [Labeo rohita]|uniref:Transport and Golgi organization protein 1 n=1 Tax=Labeo rohita TaxID=84645 RepID=A0ABQ8M5T9_LABRO|nr:Transport and Golgi organization protein 1 [Labeo rohita]
MGQRISRVFPVNGEVYDHHHSTPPKPGTDMAEQHLHPCDEPPVDAGEGHAERREEEEEEVEVEERREEEEEVEEVRREEEEVEVEERREDEVEEVRREEEEVEEERRKEEVRREAWSEVEEEKKKRKKRFWRLPSFLRAARKHLSMIRRGQTEVQLIEPALPASSTDGK